MQAIQPNQIFAIIPLFPVIIDKRMIYAWKEIVLPELKESE